MSTKRLNAGIFIAGGCWAPSNRSEPDVIRNLADNLSRQPERITATDLLSRAGRVYRGTVRNLQAGVEPLERARPVDRPSFHRMHEHHLAERSPVLRRLVEHVRELRQRVIERYHSYEGEVYRF